MSRPETGPMQFGDDWPGVFIRGDNAKAILIALQHLRQQVKEAGVTEDAIMIKGRLDHLVGLLSSCHTHHDTFDQGQVQMIKPWDEAKQG